MNARLPSVEALNASFDGSVHPSVRSDPIIRARHRSFLASHVLGALLSLVVFLVFFATVGLPTVYAMIACGWFLTPVLIALYLSRTGSLTRAHFLSAANLIGLVVLAAVLTGGIQSFAIVWMIVVPLEASLSASRRTIVWSSLAAMMALVGLYGATVLGLLPAPIDTGFGIAARELFSHLAAAAYSGALALNIQTIHDQAADAIRQEHARYRLMAENATDLISRHTTGGKVVFATPASHLLTGEAPEALLGDGLFERVLVADRPAYRAALSDAAAGECTDVEFRLRRTVMAPGVAASYFWAEMRCRPAGPSTMADVAPDSTVAIALGANMHCEVIAVTRDISRRKRYEDELLRARTTADTANRAKSLFLANMSHELRTPLNAIIGFSEILLLEMKARPDHHRRWMEHSSIIRDSGQQLLVMVNELLDISKIESGHYQLNLEPVDVEEIASACCAALQPVLAKKNMSVKVDAAGDLPDVEADARCIRQILLNLLGNAIKFSHPGNSVRLALRRDGPHIVMEIIDTGIGIARADIDRLGQPFVQADSGYDRQHEGTGLGLSLVTGMIRLHDGTFQIESEPGQGTKVTMRLPLLRGAKRSDPIVNVQPEATVIKMGNVAETSAPPKAIPAGATAALSGSRGATTSSAHVTAGKVS